MSTVTAITSTLPIEDYNPIGIVHGHAETNDPAPLSEIAAHAIDGMRAYGAQIGADLIIDTTVTFAPHGLEGVRVLATGTAIRFRSERSAIAHDHLSNGG